MNDRPTGRGEEFSAAIEHQAKRREKGRNTKALLHLWPFVRNYQLQLYCALIFLLLATTATLTLPVAAGRIVDGGFTEDQVAKIFDYFELGFIVILVMSVAGAARFYFVTWLGERVVADLRKAVYNHITGLSPAFYEVTKTGEVLSRLTADTTLIQTVVGSTVSIALRNGLGAIGAFVLLIITSPKLASAALFVILVVLVPIIVIGRMLRRLSRSSQDRIADTSAFASESLGAIQTVQAFTHEHIDRALYGKAVEDAFVVGIQRTRVRSLMTALIFFLTLGGLAFVTLLGAQAVALHEMSAGDFVKFVSYALILAASVAALSEVWSEVQRAAGATERLMELLAIESQIKASAIPVAMPTPAGRITFDNVTFRYPMRPEISALDNYSIAVEPGERVALVGPSGAGKTTTFQLLLRFYDPQSGTISIDGVDIAKASPQEVRGRISVVQQDAVIFSGSLMENIRYGRPEASDDDVKRAAVAALADDFIKRLPQQYETKLGERGIMLSGGQRQRIAIARAILRDAPVLLLDEATSALDAESERLVQVALEHIMKGRTTLVIAHRLATVVKADRIIVMDHGRVVDVGTHEALLAKGGLYAHLANLQFQNIDLSTAAAQ